MFTALVLIALALAAFGWWSHRCRARNAAIIAAADDPSGPHDAAQSYERAKAQAELQRWSGPH